MREIVCPNCHTTFQVDESTYAAILTQVRGKEFNEEVGRRAAELKQQYEAKEAAVRLEVEKSYDKQLADKSKTLADAQTEITRLHGEIAAYDARKQVELAELDKVKDRQIAELKSQLNEQNARLEVELLKERTAGETRLQAKENELTELRGKIDAEKLLAENRESQLREQHQLQLKDKQDEIDRLKDFKMRLSTKLVGESLEQHCAMLFEQAQCTGLYPEATFDKDNLAVEHSKGDFIFRDFIDGEEYVSVMFEMKNESDGSAAANKHRNLDFVDKLDKDRKRKGCEYAVLVSMLEQGNELYDQGIVDMSHRYPKMLVIRPQFFMPVLRLITESAKRGFRERLALTRELAEAREQTADFSRFEDKLNRFRESFNKRVISAHKKFTDATEGIDKTIEALEKQIAKLREIKASFEASERELLKADEMTQKDLTVKKLTHGAPSVRRMIEESND